MPRTKGAIGQKKRSLLQIIEAKARQRGKYIHPVVWLAEVYRTGRIYDNEEKTWIEVDAGQRIDAAKTVAQYVAPRIKPADLETMTEKTSQFMVRWEGIDNAENPIQENKSIESDNDQQRTKPTINPRDSVATMQTKKGIDVDGSNNTNKNAKKRQFRHIHSPVTLPR